MILISEQEREAEAIAIKECAALAEHCGAVDNCASKGRCEEKAAGIADDCPFMTQAKMALFE